MGAVNWTKVYQIKEPNDSNVKAYIYIAKPLNPLLVPTSFHIKI